MGLWAALPHGGRRGVFHQQGAFSGRLQIVRRAARLQNDIAAQQNDRAAVAVEVATE